MPLAAMAVLLPPWRAQLAWYDEGEYGLFKNGFLSVILALERFPPLIHPKPPVLIVLPLVLVVEVVVLIAVPV